MKYCTHCGKELLDDAVICVGCGCSTDQSPVTKSTVKPESLVNTYASRTKINGIIWIVIGAIQAVLGLHLEVDGYAGKISCLAWTAWRQ